jgi:hypothetical protein
MANAGTLSVFFGEILCSVIFVVSTGFSIVLASVSMARFEIPKEFAQLNFQQ